MIFWYIIENPSSISIDDVCSIISAENASLSTWNVDFQYYKGENANFLLISDSSLPDIVLVKEGLNWFHFGRNIMGYLPKLLSSSSLKLRQHQTLAGVYSKKEIWVGIFGRKMIIATGFPVDSLPFAQILNQSEFFTDGLKKLSDYLIN
jgi:hypothetical protein